MTQSQETRFKRALKAKRDELIREIHERRERIVIDLVSDPMDQVRNVAERDLAVRNVDRMYGELGLVDGALSEIRDGTFGVCVQCGHDIPVKRLEAVPWSPYCVHCQEREEQSERNGELAEGETLYALAWLGQNVKEMR